MTRSSSVRASGVIEDPVAALRRREWHLRYDNLDAASLPKLSEWFQHAQETRDPEIIQTAKAKILQVFHDTVEVADRHAASIPTIEEVREKWKNAPSYSRPPYDTPELEGVLGYSSEAHKAHDTYGAARDLAKILPEGDETEAMHRLVLKKRLTLWERELAMLQNIAAENVPFRQDAEYWTHERNVRYAKSRIAERLETIVKLATLLGDAQALRTYFGMWLTSAQGTINMSMHPEDKHTHRNPMNALAQLEIASSLPAEYAEASLVLQRTTLNLIANRTGEMTGFDYDYGAKFRHSVLELLEKMRTNPEFAAETRKEAAALIIRINIEQMDRSFRPKRGETKLESWQEGELIKELDRIAIMAGGFGMNDVQLQLLERIRDMQHKAVEELSKSARESELKQADILGAQAKWLAAEQATEVRIEEVKAKARERVPQIREESTTEA